MTGYCHSPYLTLEDIRFALGDAQIRFDAPAGLDMEYSDPEIQKAMFRALRRYNSIPPFINVRLDCANIPGDTDVFINGTLWALYTVKWQSLIRDDIPYDAGNVKVDDVPRAIEHVSAMIKLFGDLFVQEAKDRKMWINARQGNGPIG